MGVITVANDFTWILAGQTNGGNGQ